MAKRKPPVVVERRMTKYQQAVVERMRTAVTAARPALARRARYVECDLPPGAAGPWGHALRRQGLAMAAGKYVCWVSHDNLLHPHYLAAHAAHAAKADPCVSLVAADYWDRLTYLGRRPDGAGPPAPGSFDLVSLALPAKEAAEAGAFAAKYDYLREAGWHALEVLAPALPVVVTSTPLAAHF